VVYTVTDPAGLPLNAAGVSTPGAIKLSYIAAVLSNNADEYTTYTTRSVSGPGASALEPNSDSATHAIRVYGSRDLTSFNLGTNYASATYNFVPNGAKVTKVHDVVRTASCNTSEPAAIDLLFIESVGNLVCRTGYDLGEAHKIVLLSVTEGEEKPLKYPGIFFKADLMAITRVDLLPYVPFQARVAEANARSIRPDIEIVRVSSTLKTGLDGWLEWIDRRAAAIPALSRGRWDSAFA